MEEIVNILSGIRSKGVRLTLDDSGLNLKVKGDIERLTRSDKENLKQYKEDIIFLLKKALHQDDDRIAPTVQRAYYPLSSAQKRIWLLSQFEEGTVAYNIPGAYVFEGRLDFSGLEYAFNVLIARHEILRTVFTEDESGEIGQYIKSSAAFGFRISCFDLRNDTRQAESVRLLVQQATIRPFDLEKGPLMRADLFQMSDSRWVFAYTMHHIISDGWSMDVLLRELLLLYNGRAGGGSPSLPQLRIQYKDYACWLQERLASGYFQPHKEYWLQQFAGELPSLDMPVDRPRPAEKSFKGGLITRELGPGLARGLRTLSHRLEGTLFMTLLAAVKSMLYRYTNREDIIIGTAIAGREQVDLEDQIGLYVNTIALRTRLKGGDSFRTVFEKVRGVTLGAYEHQAYPFDELVNALPLKRDMSRNALFDIMVVLQNTKGKDGQAQDQSGKLIVRDYKEAEDLVCKFDLTFFFIESGEGLTTCLKYNSDIYDGSTAERMAGHLGQLLEAIVADPDKPLALLDMLTQGEKLQLLSFNQSGHEHRSGMTVTGLFEEQAARTPNQVALSYDRREITYKELDDRSNRFADYLRKTYDIHRDEVIGIQVNRSEWMIIALLGVLKSGGAYLPIDPGLPRERVSHMISDCSCKALINERELEIFKAEEWRYAPGPLRSVNNPDSLAYVIFTSGSTGQPKGVLIEHRALVNYYFAINAAYGLDPTDRVLQVSNFTFDASVEQIFACLLSGAALYIAPNDLAMAGNELSYFIQDQRITHLHATPTLLEQIDFRKIDSLRRVVSAGENCPPSLVNKVGKSAAFFNKYGPTEATISATIFKLAPGGGIHHAIPIGHPIDNVDVYILDEAGQLLPVGVTGELCIGGNGLARGYLNNPELTAARFTPIIDGHGGRIYKTGDLARWRPDGNIIFEGRKDEQVKIRGYRVEPGEIENALRNNENISSAIVVARDDKNGGKNLVAYIAGNGKLDLSDIRRRLSKTLPDYMLPAYFIEMEEWVLTGNGKTDRKSLPDPEGLAIRPAAEYIGPRNEIEKKLVLIWQEVLGRDKVGVNDNFFELGGHSLKAAQLISRINAIFSVRINIKSIFREPTVESIGEQVSFILDQSSRNKNKKNLIRIEL